MELLTRSTDPDWDRVVYVYVDKIKDTSKLVLDSEMYKLLIVDEGSMTIRCGQSKKLVVAPSIVLLSDEEISFADEKDVELTVAYFKGTEVRDEFTRERVKSGEFENEVGRVIFQDYLLIQEFDFVKDIKDKVKALKPSAYIKISKLVANIGNELNNQVDGFWPCRSRSYLMELLYYIRFLHSDNDTVDVKEKTSSDMVSDIIEYLSEHISERVAVEDIVKEYSINRNILNQIFIKEVSMTCMNYFEKMRMSLAQTMLAETELQIAEIADRVGYPDSNYFAKVFKKYTGVTPSKYRESSM